MLDLRLETLLLRQGGFQLKADVRVKTGTLGLSGKSGGGKTTLLELIAGLRMPDQGRIRLGNVCLNDAALAWALPARSRRIGYVHQDADLFPHLSVRQNLDFGADRAAGSGPALNDVVEALGLADLVGRPGAGLSGGERRRVALGRALLSGPSLLLLDEPFAGLDTPARSRLRDGLRALHARFDIPWILVSHDRADLRGLCERVMQVRDGSLVV